MERRIYRNSVVYAISRNDNPNSQKVIYENHCSRGEWCYEMSTEEWDALSEPKENIGWPSQHSRDGRAYLGTMVTSKGTEYWVMLEKGDRTMSMYVHDHKNRAEYGVAELNWLLHGGEKPCVLDYPDPE